MQSTHAATAITGRQLFIRNSLAQKTIFILLAALCCTSFITPPVALLLGLIVAQVSGQPFARQAYKATHWLLQLSVVGLGFGMTVTSALQAGKQSLAITIVSIIITLLLGTLLGRWLLIEKKTAFLVAAGTAICGGSAIAAIAPVIKAEEKQISVALGVVFVLNAVALYLFPVVGHLLHLSGTQFGVWCAVAIHDTSSVTGAAARYGTHALEIATTVKLARALWIIPVAFLSGLVFKQGAGKVTVPWFIALFIIAMIIHTYVPAVEPYAGYIVHVAKAGLTLTLFLIGSGLSVSTLRKVGAKSFIQGGILWVMIALVNLWVIIVMLP
ncbi:conserved hypothetical integral membrane protein [Filimonas lacunae]|uniref:Conserved hypothetical integral membrane protein n=1 Tax=Filimonas lacunae TaxID=477680 RepID=A0A173MF96_9BACT|nr:putative sulfate exporter family transporter [Filimonas lacunae]BAV06101.1 membrane protein YeiH [Filimonas lacunae]SIT24656.1 conserved hypothetical integral membrane protein [Filimonas lacunae]